MTVRRYHGDVCRLKAGSLCQGCVTCRGFLAWFAVQASANHSLASATRRRSATYKGYFVSKRGLLSMSLAVVTSLGALNTQAGDSGHLEEHGSAFPHQTLGVFIGDTTEGRRQEGVTLGLEYEYRFTESLGVAGIVEHVWGDFNTSVYVVPLAFHKGPWKVYAGPGIEDGEEGSEKLFRLGLEYGFHVGDYEISPQVDADFVGGESLLVFGVVLARPF